MKIPSVLKWMLFLVLLIVAGVAGATWWFWQQSDTMLKETIVEKLSEAAPDMELSLEDAQFDWQNQSQVYLTDLRFKASGHSGPILTIPKATLTLDPALLKDQMKVLIRKIEVQDAHLDLVRRSDGSWNYQDLGQFRQDESNQTGFPEIAVNRMSVSLRIEHGGSSLGTGILIDQMGVRCIPKAEKHYLIEGTAEIRNAGTLTLHGEWDLAHSQWKLNGRMANLPAGQPLLELISDVDPDSKEKMARVDERLKSIVPHTQQQSPAMQFASAFDPEITQQQQELIFQDDAAVQPLVPVSHSTASPLSESVPDFGISGDLLLNFRLSQDGAEEDVDYRVLLQLSNGQLDNPLLPFPLRELNAKLYLDRHQLLIRDCHSVNGETELSLEVDALIHGMVTPGTIRASVRNLPITSKLKNHLSLSLQKAYDELNPTGLLDFEGVFHYDGFGTWNQEEVTYSFREGSVLVRRFPYPIQQVEGTVIPRFHDDGRIVFQYRFQGVAGRQPVSVTGWGRPKSQGGEALFDIKCQSLPIDETFIAACSPQARQALEMMHLRGDGNLEVRLSRPPGENQKFDTSIGIEISKGSIEYDRFPYPVKNITASVKFDSSKEIWLFENIKGQHGDAHVNASGTFSRKVLPNRLELNVLLDNAPLDHQLERAMREDLHQLWDELSPSGRVTARCHVVWIPDRGTFDVSLPSVRIQNGSLMLKHFRYSLEEVNALLDYEDGVTTIREFSARHDETIIRAEGEYLREPNDLWRLRLRDLKVDDLIPDRQFRNALPKSMRDGFDTLSPEGNITIDASMIELRGSESHPDNVTAAWNLAGYVAGIDFFAGIDITNAHGMFTSRGTFDGTKVRAEGDIDLDSAVGLGQQLTKIRGPFRVEDRIVVVGAGDSLVQGSRGNTDRHLTARVIGGVLQIDSRAIIGEQSRDVYGRISGEPTRYRVRAELSGGRLEEFARRNITGAGNLQGIMNGEINLQGAGDDPANLSGNGKLMIRPAALYELPVVLQIFQRLNVVAPLDNRAFDEAFLDFRIRNEQFDFNSIDLLGNSLSLRGRGSVRFDGKLDLVFYSTNPKSQLAIPVIRELVNGASYGLVAVNVSGSVNQPITQVKTNFVIDNALRNFLGGFQPFAPLFPGINGQRPLPTTSGTKPGTSRVR